MKQPSWNSIVNQIIAGQTLISATFSKPSDNQKSARIRVQVKPVMKDNKLTYLIASAYSQKELHHHVTPEECRLLLEEELLTEFQHAVVFTTEHDYYLLKGKNLTIRTKPPTKSPADFSHNKAKKHILIEGELIPFLQKLGLMTSEGKIRSDKADKFRQINRFLEMVRDVLPHLNKNRKLNVIDFGCGKAYLTFALYHYLNQILGLDIHFIGIDLKEDVIKQCEDLAHSLGWNHRMEFIVGDINEYHPPDQVDMVISLHACNTATDSALEKAVRWKAEVILSVPCCHQELLSQIQHESLAPLLKHGILKERFSAIVTDAARAQILEILGYQTQVVEFIDLEHTAKNLMIRAWRKKGKWPQKEALSKYIHFAKELHVHPYLERLFSKELDSMNESV